MTTPPDNTYLFHWTSIERLQRLEKSGVMKPYWTHYLFEEKRYGKGISTCHEPMLWHPDEELHREPCLIIDRTTIEAPSHDLESGETYHLTKAIRNARKAGKPIEPILESVVQARKRTHCTTDEVFIEGPISKDSVVAIGFQDDDLDHTGQRFTAIKAIADAMNLPLLDMTDWEIGSPGYRETDEIVNELIGRTSTLRP